MAKKKIGRPRIQLNWDDIKKLCNIFATQEEIAYFCECSVDTLDRAAKRQHSCSFAEFYKTHNAKGRINLRRNMVVMSKTNAAMAIFLSKNILGYKDKTEVSTDSESNTIKVAYSIDK